MLMERSSHTMASIFRETGLAIIGGHNQMDTKIGSVETIECRDGYCSVKLTNHILKSPRNEPTAIGVPNAIANCAEIH